MSGVSLYLIEILHQTTTIAFNDRLGRRLYLIEILHQTTTQSTVDRNSAALYLIEILHQTTTIQRWETNLAWLYLIEILHQTTTTILMIVLIISCILSKFYIKPQHFINARDRVSSCILSKFYIKPQLYRTTLRRPVVVSYRNSTSNHNNARRQWRFQQLYLIEILHQTTTPKTSVETS